jgi:hypothetical protein
MIVKKKKVLSKMKILKKIGMCPANVKKSIRVVIDPTITEGPIITLIIRLRVVIIQIEKRIVVINVNDER